MNTAVIILCHNQQEFVDLAVKMLLDQTIRPTNIIVFDDCSAVPYQTVHPEYVTIIRSEKTVGRARGRNLGINKALEFGAQILIFFDGDSYPADNNFIENYQRAFAEYPAKSISFYGMREHIQRPINLKEYIRDEECYTYEPIINLPSSLLNTNNDNLYLGYDLNYKDYREISGIVDLYNKMTSFNEKMDLILTGRITWSCNFAIDADGLESIKNLNDYLFFFDDHEFKSWGHEDVAFGIDSMFAGVECKLITNTYVKHFLHERAPEDTVVGRTEGRHKIMNRYRRLLARNLIVGP